MNEKKDKERKGVFGLKKKSAAKSKWINVLGWMDGGRIGVGKMHQRFGIFLSNP